MSLVPPTLNPNPKAQIEQLRVVLQGVEASASFSVVFFMTRKTRIE